MHKDRGLWWKRCSGDVSVDGTVVGYEFVVAASEVQVRHHEEMEASVYVFRR